MKARKKGKEKKRRGARTEINHKKIKGTAPRLKQFWNPLKAP